MSSVKTPNYVLTEDFQIYTAATGTQMLPAGAFVRPIEKDWLPKHTKEETSRHFDYQSLVHCYTRFGIIVIPRDKLRET